MKTKLLIIIVFALIPFVFLNVDASCDKNVGSADESCTPAELLEICDTLWSPRYDGSPTPGNIFCNAVYDLDLNESDVEKLGLHLDWENYAILSSQDFVDGWGFYEDHAITDTLLIYPSISMRDSLPPTMKVQISFDWIDESEIKRFDESMNIYIKYNREIIPLPENTWVIMPPHVSDSRNTENPNECWYQEDDGSMIPCKMGSDEFDMAVVTFLVMFGPYIALGIAIVIIFMVWRKRK